MNSEMGNKVAFTVLNENTVEVTERDITDHAEAVLDVLDILDILKYFRKKYWDEFLDGLDLFQTEILRHFHAEVTP